MFPVCCPRRVARPTSAVTAIEGAGNGPPCSADKQELQVPKMKTKSGAAKRFRAQGSGGIKRGKAFLRHILTKKTTKRKRNLRGTTQVHESNTGSVRAMMPYA
jgi:large subunit ribosomal protein L35